MFENQREAWQRRSSSSRLGIALGSLAILALLIAAMWHFGKRDYEVLFSGLDPHDAATIVAELDKLKVPYRLGADETTILVEESQVHSTRLKLMGKGVNLRGGVGFEIFNTTDFGVTEFAQKINYQRALQGELARTIMALDAVKSARVHLVLPDSALFRRTAQKPKASIALALREGRSLQPEQVLGIQRLVAASVPQIDAASVTVLDQRGIALSRNADPDGEDAVLGLGGKHDIETHLARKVVAVLDKAFGPGSAIVTVDVTLNHEQVRTLRESVMPYAGGNGARAVLRSRTSSQGSTASAATPALATASDPQATTVAPAGAPARTAATVSEVEYQNSRVVEQSVARPGSIRRVSIAVVLPRALPADRLKQVTQVLSAAAGLNRERGDEIAISSIDQFAATAPAQAAPGDAPDDDGRMQDDARPAAPKAASPDPAIEGLGGAALALAVLLALALIAALVALAASRRKLDRAKLSADEREKMLVQMRQWLGARAG